MQEDRLHPYMQRTAIDFSLSKASSAHKVHQNTCCNNSMSTHGYEVPTYSTCTSLMVTVTVHPLPLWPALIQMNFVQQVPSVDRFSKPRHLKAMKLEKKLETLDDERYDSQHALQRIEEKIPQFRCYTVPLHKEVKARDAIIATATRDVRDSTWLC